MDANLLLCTARYCQVQFGSGIDTEIDSFCVSAKMKIKGLAGLNYWSSGVSGAGGELGINIGGNLSFPINDDYYYIEPRITLISNAAFFVGIGTYF